VRSREPADAVRSAHSSLRSVPNSEDKSTHTPVYTLDAHRLVEVCAALGNRRQAQLVSKPQHAVMHHGLCVRTQHPGTVRKCGSSKLIPHTFQEKENTHKAAAAATAGLWAQLRLISLGASTLWLMGQPRADRPKHMLCPVLIAL
jgi:hypothetical protein